MDSLNDIEFKRLFNILKSKIIYIVLILTIAVSVGYFYSFYFKVPLYQSSSTIVLAMPNNGTSSDAVTQSDLTLNQKLVSTYSQIVKSKNVLNQTINNLGIDIDADTLSKEITVSSVSDTEIIEISVTDSNAEEAANITNELVNVFSAEVKDIYNIDNISIIDEAKVETVPYNINHAKDLVISFVIGIVVSCAFIFLLYIFDTSIKDEKDVKDYIKLNVLSQIPIYSNSKNEKQSEYEEIVTANDYLSPISETFRNLKINLTFKKDKNSIKNILVTSMYSGEGKSWVSANLASIFAQANKNVLIIDSDMRKGRQHTLFKVPNKKGLSNCLISANSDEELTIDQIVPYITETKIPGIHLITSGTLPPNPSELLSSNKMKILLHEVDKIYDIVIIDGCPCKMVSDSIGLSHIVDTSIIVVECKRTKIDDVRNVKQQIENLGGNISGIVLNKISVPAKFYKNSYYYGNKPNNNLISEKAGSTVSFKTVKELMQNYIENNEKNLEVSSSSLPVNNTINNLDDFKEILANVYNQISKITYQENLLQSKNNAELNNIKNSINTLSNNFAKLQNNSNSNDKLLNALQDSIADLNNNLLDKFAKLQDNSNSDDKLNALQDSIVDLNNNLSDSFAKLQTAKNNEHFEQLKTSIANIKESQKDEKALVNLSLAVKDLINICNSQKQLIEQQVKEINSIKNQIAQMNLESVQNRSINVDNYSRNDENIISFEENANKYSAHRNNTTLHSNNTDSNVFSSLFNKRKKNEYSIYDSIPYEDLEKNSSSICQILNTSNNVH